MNILPCRVQFFCSGGLRPALRRRYNSLGLALIRGNGKLFADFLLVGGVAERLIAPVLKTGRPKGLVSSNLTPSAPLVGRARDAECITVSHNIPADFPPCLLLSAEVSQPTFPGFMRNKTNGQPGATGGGGALALSGPAPPLNDQPAENFSHKKECEQDPWAWAAARLPPKAKLQRDDYDFRSWMKGATKKQLDAGCFYEYARESHTFRCLCALDRRPRGQFRGILTPLERKTDGYHGDLLGSAWETWLHDFADELVENKSFAEVQRTSRSKVEKSLKALPAYSLCPKAVESPSRYNIVPDRKIGLRHLGLQEVVIDWRHYTNKQIAAEIARLRPETEPEPDRRGREPQSKTHLKELSVMRIWKHKRKAWERLKLVDKVCGYESCMYEWPIPSAARAHMSRARQSAFSFFKFLFPFPGEIPENY